MIDEVTFAECYARRVEADIEGLQVNMISLPDLKTNKKASGRNKDLADLASLPYALAVRQSSLPTSSIAFDTCRSGNAQPAPCSQPPPFACPLRTTGCWFTEFLESLALWRPAQRLNCRLGHSGKTGRSEPVVNGGQACCMRHASAMLRRC